MVNSMRRGLMALGLAVMVGGLLVWLWRPAPSATELARQAYVLGELSRTLDLLQSQTVDGQGLLLRANCLRQLGRNDEFRELLAAVSDNPELKEATNLAQALYNIHHATTQATLPQVNSTPQQLMALLVSGGALRQDAYSVVIQGLFQKNDLDAAETVLRSWESSAGAGAQADYLWAVYYNLRGSPDETEKRLLQVIEQHPEHELSWLALAELLSRPPQVRLEQSLHVLERMTERFPSNMQTGLRRSQLQRRLGRPTARPTPTTAAATTEEAVEQALVAMDLGQFSQAWDHWSTAGWPEPEAFQYLIDKVFETTLQGRGAHTETWNQRISRGATTLALMGRMPAAQRIFQQAANRTSRLRRLQDLDVQQAFRPRDEQLSREMQSIATLEVDVLPTVQVTGARTRALTYGDQLYAQHCAHCHGERGDGRGIASPNLSPPARNFLTEPIRFVSTADRLPTLTDLIRTIRNGEPGTSMPAFAQFSDEDLRLVAEVIANFMPSRALSNQTSIEVPQIEQSAELVETGRLVFERSGCAGCHVRGSDNVPGPQLFDTLGRPIRAPDLARDAFHGGSQAADIYRRIVLGIPGTPHPQLVTLNADEPRALVAYILSLR